MNVNIGHRLVTLTQINGSLYTLYGFNVENNEPYLHFVISFEKNGKASKLYKEKEIYHSAYKADPPHIPIEIKVQIDAMFKGWVLNAL